MLYLGSDVKRLPKKSCEAMGNTRLVYSPIQLQMDNQYHIDSIANGQSMPYRWK